MKYYQTFCPTRYNTHKARKKSRAAKSGRLMSDDILTFDIEVSSAWKDGDKLIPYTPGHTEEYWNSKKPYSLCYIWQFSFNGEVYYGRKLEEFATVLSRLPGNVQFTIWVHNLSYEFEFLCNLFEWVEVFARKAHSPMKCVPDAYPNIEFRCSYYLTRMSLDTWGRELGLPKLVGNLDYTKLRTPNTPLTDAELAYCARDCEVVDLGIRKYLKKYKHIESIPLTQTGEVRREVKQRMRKDKAAIARMIKLIPADAHMYGIMKQAFAGGYTHANYTYAGVTVRMPEGHAFDFASSYPAVMCSEAFPMTPFRPDHFDEAKTDTTAYLMRVRFECIEPLTENHYISVSKCINLSTDALRDNGRLIRAAYAEMWITEQDYDVITSTYECEPHVLECYSSEKAYLPRPLVETVFELYNNKTQYKGLSAKADIYAVSKQFINSLFGMCVTDLIQDEVTFDEFNGWGKEDKTEADVNAYLDDLRDNNKGRTFLAYQFGVWITAYARHNLWECIQQCDDKVIYCDTDSIKLAGWHDFSDYNNKVAAKITKCCTALGLNPDIANPVDKFGNPHPLGYFCEEDTWSEFKTLGAKRYCYRDNEDGQLHLTVSGISKQAVVCLHDDIENFNEDTVFDKDYFTDFKRALDEGEHWCDQFDGMTFDEVRDKFGIKDGTKKMHIYHKQDPVVWNEGEPDEFTSTCFQGIVLRNTSYSMGMAADYAELLAAYYENEDEHLNVIGRYED